LQHPKNNAKVKSERKVRSMSAIRIIGYIAAGVLIFFGVLFIWGAFSAQGSPGWIVTGVIIVLIGFGVIFFASRIKPTSQAPDNVTLKIDLPANVELDSFKCQSCGGALTTENIKMVAGAPVVTCPYCGSIYQLTEEPKW
jgi:Na+/melibiose symporter-like transporter